MTDALKSYATPWKGHLVLACKKCQKKLNGHGALGKVKKAIRHKQQGGVEICVLNVPCMDVCPKNGVAVVDPRRGLGGLYILRDDGDIDGLIEILSRS